MDRSLIVSILVFSVFGGVTGLECYSCDDVLQPSLCNVSQVCSQPGQVCIQAENVNDNFQFSYKLGCGGIQYCHDGNKRNLRHFCCSADFCNKDISSSTIQSTTSVSHTTSRTTPTISRTTPTTSRTTPTTRRTTPTTSRTTPTTRRTTPTTSRTTNTTLTSQQTKPTHETVAPTQFEHNCSGHGYYRWNHKCYYLTSHLTAWYRTRHGDKVDPCEEHHMHMAILSSYKEHIALVNFIRKIYQYNDAVWLGGSYSDNHDEWRWIAGKHINSHDTLWASHWETQEHECLALVGDKWRSRHCSHNYKHLCETWNH
ncbi:uncharacterized protein LOC127726007 [Mytilus californianus]|uniref:uncharacterized protein LOC127726007 n=1 Tax=Mytilus californianus TaxID=6549 RepID=UPI002248351E|nr:uncharacterized protein LOC127726007 [Mytilus californianus]